MSLGCCSIAVIIIDVIVIIAIVQELVVVPGDFSLHVVHASVTEFDGVCVANFVKSVGPWEGLLNDCQELFTNVCFYIFTEGWVEPSHFPIPNLCSWGSVPGIVVKFKFVAVTTSLQSSLVWWNGCGENFFIGRDFRKPIFNILG